MDFNMPYSMIGLLHPELLPGGIALSGFADPNIVILYHLIIFFTLQECLVIFIICENI